MLKLLIPMLAVTAATFALQPPEARAECNANHYLQDSVTADNKVLGKQVGCLAETLPHKGAAITENDMKTAEKIIRLSNKIIGNGVAPSAQVAGAVAIVPDVGALKRDSDAAKKIACLASGYLSGPSIAADLLTYKGTCAGIDDARQEIIVAGKIIGNG